VQPLFEQGPCVLYPRLRIFSAAHKISYLVPCIGEIAYFLRLHILQECFLFHAVCGMMFQVFAGVLKFVIHIFEIHYGY